MAFPFLGEENFELGTRGSFDAISNGNTKITFAHASDLAAIPGLPAPFRGAYVMQLNLALGTTDAYVQETGDYDTSASGTIYNRFYVWFGGATGSLPVMADTDIFGIFQLWSGTNTPEGTVGIEYTTANGYRWFVNETAASSGAAYIPLVLNKWTCIELKSVIDSGGGNDGTLTMTVDGQAATAITAVDQGAITSAVYGAVGMDAGTTRGYLLFDQIVADDAQVYPINVRYPDTLLFTKSGHAFIGPGKIANVTLMSGAGTDNVCTIFDTDVASVLDASNTKVELKNTANTEMVDPAGMPVYVNRGAYIQISGTNPRALIQIERATAYGSDGAVRTYAASRKPTPRNV